MDLMELFVKIGADTSGLDKGISESKSKLNSLTSGLGKIAGGVGKTIATIGKVGLAATGAAAAGVGAMVMQAQNAYGEYEQLVGGMDTLFKDSSQKMQQYADEAYKTAQISKNDYMALSTSFAASLLQSVDNDTEQAAEMANMAVIDMADNANKMGTAMESIQNAYQGFAKQNYTMLDNLKLGYGGTKSEMERLLEDAEKLNKEKFNVDVDYDIESFSDIVDAIHVIQDEMGITGTSAKEATETIQGSFNMMKSAWSNLITDFGNENANLDADIEQLVDSAQKYLKNLLPVVTRTITAFGKSIKKVAPVLSKELPKLINDVLPALIDAAITLVSSLTEAIVTSLPTLFKSVADAVVPNVKSLLTKLRDTLENVDWDEVGRTVSDGIKSIFNMEGTFGEIVTLGAEIIGNLVKGIGEAAPKILTAMASVLADLIRYVSSHASDIVGTAIDIISGLAQGLVEAIPVLIPAIVELIAGIGSAIIQNLPRLLEMGGEIAMALLKGIGESFTQDPAGTLVAVGAFGLLMKNKLVDNFSPAVDLISSLLDKIADKFKKTGDLGLDELARMNPGDMNGGGGVKGFLGQDLATATATTGGKLATAGAVAGTAVMAFSLTSTILELTGLDEKLGEVGGHIYDFFHKAEQEAGVASASAIEHASQAAQGLYPIQTALSELDSAIASSTGNEQASLQQLRDTLAASAGDIETSTSNAASAVDTNSASWQNMSDSFATASQAMTDFSEQSKNAANNTSVFGNIADTLSDAGNTIVEFWSAVPGQIGDALSGIGDNISEAFSGVVDWFASIPDKVGEVISNIRSKIDEFVAGVGEWFASIPEKAGELGLAIGEGIGEFILKLQEIRDAIPELIENIGTFFSELPGRIGEWLASPAASIGEWFVSLRETINTKVSEIVESVGTFFTELPGKIGEWLSATAASIGEWFASVYETVSTKVSEIITSVGTALAELPGKVSEWLSNTIQKVSEFATNMATKAKEAGTEFLNNLVNTMKTIPGKMMQIGKEIVNGVWKGIESAKSIFTSSVNNFFGGIVTGVKNKLGVHSPSTVFAGIGSNLILGLEKGWSSNIGSATRLIQSGLDFSSIMPKVEPLQIEGMIPSLNPIQAQSNGNSTGNEEEENNRPLNITLELDKVAFAHLVYKYNKQESQRVGVSLAGGTI